MNSLPIQSEEKAFLSTPSVRRATVKDGISLRTQEFLSTPSVRRATRTPAPSRAQCAISIHALREEGDSHGAAPAVEGLDFYPRPP